MSDGASQRTFTIRQAAFIGVGAMVGAGIFSLLGAAGEVAGAAVWLSFAIAGVIAGLQGYSFAKFGSRYPSAGGLLEYVARGFGVGHLSTGPGNESRRRHRRVTWKSGVRASGAAGYEPISARVIRARSRRSSRR
jgi:amino acid transporter